MTTAVVMLAPKRAHHAFSSSIWSCSSWSYAGMAAPRFTFPQPRRKRPCGHLDLWPVAAQRFHRDGACRCFVVADDERDSRAARIGALHLRLEISTAGVRDDGKARAAQVLRRAAGERSRALAGMHDVGERRGIDVPLRSLQEQDHALDAHAEAAGGGRPASELFEQSVVASPAGNGTLRAEPIGDELEHRAVVVIEPAHEARVDRVGE